MPRSKPDGYSVNVRCLDDGQVIVTSVGLFDGQHWEEAFAALAGQGLTMHVQILMPKLSPTMEEGRLVKWHVKEGDAVRSGDVVAEVETDKATMEVEAAEDGVIGKLLHAEGTEHVPVNHPIALLITEDEAQPRPQRAPPLPSGERTRRSRCAKERSDSASDSARVRGVTHQSSQKSPYPDPLPSGEREKPSRC